MEQKELQIKNLIKAKVKQKNPLAEIVLFGSHARGDFNKNSDWDILILLNQNHVNRLEEKEYRDELFDIELEVGEPISTIVLSKTDWENKHKITPLYQSIKREGILL